jgi:hypothetical protein
MYSPSGSSKHDFIQPWKPGKLCWFSSLAKGVDDPPTFTVCQIGQKTPHDQEIMVDGAGFEDTCTDSGSLLSCCVVQAI